MLGKDEALALVKAQKPEEHMILHALQAAAVMRALAERLGQDQDLWESTGLLHDLDYPDTKDTPQRHGLESARLLAGKLPEEAVRAIAAHNGEMTGQAPEGLMDFGLRCAESVTGLIHAARLMRPAGYVGLEAKSLKKKMKDKAFARAVRRENILECEKCGLPLDDFLTLAARAMAALEAGQGQAG